MKKFLVLAVLVAVSISMSGCGGCANKMKHIKSDMIGLDRHISLFNSNGGIIKEWDTRAQVEDRGGTCYFINKEGKSVIISGTFIIEEK